MRTPTNRLSELFDAAGLIDRLGESIPGLVYVFDLLENRNVFTNRPLADLLGYSPEEIRAFGVQLLNHIVHPEDLSRVALHHAAVKQLAEGEVAEIEYRVRAATREWLWLHSWESALTRDEMGSTRQLLGIAHDVTARVRAEEELRTSQKQLAESEQRWRSIVENPFDFVVVIDRQYKYTFVNFVAPGLKLEDLIGKATPFDITAKEHHAAMRAAFDKVFSEGLAGSYEVYVPSLDAWYSSLVGPIRDGATVTHASVLTRDISVEKRLAEQARRAELQLRSMEVKLAQSAKLEAVGQLAGGIAHDFNNLLTGISGIGELLTDHEQLDDAVRTELLQELREAVSRGVALTRQLLAFSRQQPITSSVIDLTRLFSETGRMLRRLIREDIELQFPETTSAVVVQADRTQLEQVLVNLALNARDAMPKGGRVRFTIGAVEVGETNRLQYPDARPGSYARLGVEDSGTGMDEALMGRIFEPFFTTKAMGAGTGLGLATVHGIVHQNGGFIQVRSTLGEGSTFEIYLPRREPGVATEAPSSRSCCGGNESILLVEDDLLAQGLTRRLLERLGYAVECAGRGDDALRMIETTSRYDLVLTDVLLPGLDGHSLHQAATRLRPGLAVVLMSGYTAEVFAGSAEGDIGAAFLQKPFSQTELAEKVRAALDARVRSVSD